MTWTRALPQLGRRGVRARGSVVIVAELTAARTAVGSRM